MLVVLPIVLIDQFKQQQYDAYVAECLRIITENTARCVKEGTYIKAKWTDLIGESKKDDRSGDEIAAAVIKAAGLKVDDGFT